MTASESTEGAGEQQKAIHIFERPKFQIGAVCPTLCGIEYVPTGFDVEAPKCEACQAVFGARGGQWAEAVHEPSPVVVDLEGDSAIAGLLRHVGAEPSLPVVPSVGAVPVEVPEDALRAGACALANVVRLPDWLQVRALGHDMRPLAQLALAAAYPLIAARVQAELEAEDECPRTTCQQIAATASDVYCEVTGGQLSYPTYDARTILSHANDQTQKLIDDECARVRAEERQRAEREQQWANQHLLTVMAMLIGCTVDELVDQMWMDPHGQYEITDTITSLRAQITATGSAIPPAEPATCAHGSSRAHSYTHLGRLPKLRCPGPVEQLRAAGSAVPVATPQPVGMNAPNGEPLIAVTLCEHGRSEPHSVEPTMEQIFWREYSVCPGPVATPTEPVDEVKCPGCEATIRARMSDQPAVGVDFTVTVTDRAGRTVFVGAVDVARGDEYLVIDRAKDRPATLRCVASDLTAQLPAEQDGQR